jgi:hypothetical protein
MWTRWVAWLDLHVKGNKAEPAAEKKEGGQ